MTAVEVLRAVDAAGLTVRADGIDLVVCPCDRLNDELRGLLVAHKPTLLRLLPIREALTAAIHRACDSRGDDDTNRAALLVECAGLSLEAQADMLAHFLIVAAQYETINRGTPA